MIKFGKVIYRNIQEQVAKNTEDIAKIFRRPVLQVKMVEELPEEGEEGILYLLPATDPELGNYYEEYLWIDSAWELIGSSSVDISNMVTTDTEQEITGAKTINNELAFSNGTAWLKITNNGWTSTIQQQSGVGLSFGGASLTPTADGTKDFGSATMRWKDTYLSGIAYFYGANYLGSITNRDNRMIITYGGADRLRVGNSDSDFATNLNPKTNAVFDLGSSTAKWKDLYLAGKVDLNGEWELVGNSNGSLNLRRANTNIFSFRTSDFIPNTNNSKNLGASGLAFKDLYLTGGINPSEVQLSNINANLDSATMEVKTMFVNGITTIVFYAKVSAYMNANAVLFRSNKAPSMIRNFLGRNQAEGTYSSASAQFMIDTNGDVITLASAAANNEICFTLIY